MTAPSSFMAASIASAQQDWPTAFKLWQQVAEQQPSSATAWERTATAAWHIGQKAVSFAAMQHSLSLEPSNAGRWFTLGAWYGASKQVEQARACFLAAVREKPTYVEALVEAGNTYFGEGRYPEALACYAGAQAAVPYCPEAVWNRSLIELAEGLMPDAWEGYEARWHSPLFREPRKRPFMDHLPEWNGRWTSHLLVHGEQGIGDHVQLLRYVPLIAARVEKVTVIVRDEMVSYTKHVLPDFDVIGWSDTAPSDGSAHHPLFSAPFVFQAHAGNCPLPLPHYMAGNETTDLRIGICWAGNRAHPRDKERSATATTFRPIITDPAVADVCWVNLQHGDPGRLLRRLYPAIAIDEPPYEDVLGLCRLIATCDLVLTVDTAVAHLAGSLGIPTFMLVHKVPDFRWLLEGDRTFWYGSLRLLRQKVAGDWDAPVEEMLALVRQFMEGL